MTTVTIDPMRCEGAKKCAVVCETKVFVMKKPDPGLPWYVRLKVLAHGGKQAFVRDESACTACMKCVELCPEDAIVVRPS